MIDIKNCACVCSHVCTDIGWLFRKGLGTNNVSYCNGVDIIYEWYIISIAIVQVSINIFWCALFRIALLRIRHCVRVHT